MILKTASCWRMHAECSQTLRQRWKKKQGQFKKIVFHHFFFKIGAVTWFLFCLVFFLIFQVFFAFFTHFLVIKSIKILICGTFRYHAHRDKKQRFFLALSTLIISTNNGVVYLALREGLKWEANSPIVQASTEGVYGDVLVHSWRDGVAGGPGCVCQWPGAGRGGVWVPGASLPPLDIAWMPPQTAHISPAIRCSSETPT